MRALLDTCTLLWLVSDSARISATASKAIDAADDLYLSDASIWELGLKWNAGKIELPTARPLWPEETVTRRAQRPRIREIDPRITAETRSERAAAIRPALPGPPRRAART